jgi:hypothetical protein
MKTAPRINPIERGTSDTLPAYLRVPEACRLSSFGKSTMNALIANGSIASRLVKTSRHNVSGLRLISTSSLLAFIESFDAK